MGGLGPLDTVNWDPLGGPNTWYSSPSLPDGYTLGCPRMGHPIDEYGVFGDMVYRPDRGRTLLRDIPRSPDLWISGYAQILWISGSLDPRGLGDMGPRPRDRDPWILGLDTLQSMVAPHGP